MSEKEKQEMKVNKPEKNPAKSIESQPIPTKLTRYDFNGEKQSGQKE